MIRNPALPIERDERMQSPFFSKLRVRNLFPHFDPSLPYDEQRNYIEDVLCQLAADKDISVVELMNQPVEWASTLAGQVILGHGVDTSQDNRYLEGVTVPVELSGYRVKIRSIEYERVLGPDEASERGKVIERIKRPIRWTEGTRHTGYVKRNRSQIQKKEFMSQDLNVEEAEVNLPDAWRCLAQGGRWCNKLSSERLQRRQWYYEEVLPGAKDSRNSKGS